MYQKYITLFLTIKIDKSIKNCNPSIQSRKKIERTQILFHLNKIDTTEEEENIEFLYLLECQVSDPSKRQQVFDYSQTNTSSATLCRRVSLPQYTNSKPHYLLTSSSKCPVSISPLTEFVTKGSFINFPSHINLHGTPHFGNPAP